MEDYKNKSLIEVAKELVKEKITFYELYNKVCEVMGFDEEEKKAHIAQFYTDVTASGDFVYCGEDLWNLKANEKTDILKEEYYSEHLEVEGAEEEPKPKKRKHTAKTVEVEEDVDVDDEYDDNQGSSYENVVDDYDDDDYESSHQKDFDSQLDEDDDEDYDDYDDESDNDADEFDEDDYNEIMDDYEEKYY